MKVVEIKTFQEAANLMSTIGVLQIALMVSEGNIVEVEDENKGVKYVFNPKEVAV